MGNVKPIPAGMHTLTPHIVVKGAKQAIEFYAKAFGAKSKGAMDGPGGAIIHAEVTIGDSTLMIADEMPDMGNKAPTSLGGTAVTIHVYTEDADKMFNAAVAAGASVMMPMSDMFWGDRYGLLRDPFGHQWSIATHKQDFSPDEMKRRMDEQMANPGKP